MKSMENRKKSAASPAGESRQLPAPTKGIRGFLCYLISCCPYTMLVKKILRFLRGEAGTQNEPISNREIHLRSNMKIGFGIMLIGIFCPIFWISFLFGARGDELMFNAVHSGIVILFGLLYIATYWIQLRNERAKKEHEELLSQDVQSIQDSI